MISLKSFSPFAILVLILSLSITLPAQNQVHGLVLDAKTNDPMPFVTIAVVGSTYGTITNQNGEFALNPEKINSSENIAFYYLGYETITMKVNDLKDGMTVKIKEKPFSMRAITIVAHPLSPETVIRKAIENREVNYPRVAQKREVFQRSNRASYINEFDLSLKESNIPEVDKNLIREMVDSLPRYTRSYSDYLYSLYTIPADSGKVKSKIEGIKNVILKEDNGGELDNITNIVKKLFVHKKDDNTFWKYKTGPFSFKESHVTFSSGEPVADLTDPKNLYPWYYIFGDLNWDWDFIQKPGHYHYQNKGIIGIGGEDAYAISFKGKSGGDYQGMMYISTGSFAILRLEYSQKERKKGKGFDMLGVSYSEDKDDGLLLYERDKSGYFLKYSMRNKVTSYGIERSFEIIRKQKRPIFNKKLDEAALRLNLNMRQEECNETLVVYREGSTADKFSKVKETGVKPDRITSYSDEIWNGYSIIEPTRQMKEYQSKIKN